MTWDIGGCLIEVQTIDFEVREIFSVITQVKSIPIRFFNLLYPLFTNLMYEWEEKVDQNWLIERREILNIILQFFNKRTDIIGILHVVRKNNKDVLKVV